MCLCFNGHIQLRFQIWSKLAVGIWNDERVLLFQLQGRGQWNAHAETCTDVLSHQVGRCVEEILVQDWCVKAPICPSIWKAGSEVCLVFASKAKAWERWDHVGKLWRDLWSFWSGACKHSKLSLSSFYRRRFSWHTAQEFDFCQWSKAT